MTATPWSPGPGRFRALRAYAAVQPGSWRSWLVVWILQGIRHLPAYVLPYLTGVLIDHIDPQQPDRALRILPWVMSAAVVLCVGNVIATTAGRQILSRINRTMVADLRGALLRRLHLLSLRFHDRSSHGSLQNTFLLDVGRLEALQGFLAEGILMHGTAILVMLGIVAATNPVLLVVIAAAVPMNVLVVRLLWRRIQSRSEEFRIAEGQFLSHLQEALAGLRLTRAHATEAFMEQRVEATAHLVAAQGMRLDFVQNLFGSTSWAVSSLLHMTVVGLGVALCVGGQHQVTVMGLQVVIAPITIGQLTVMLSYYTLISAALGSILGGLPAVAAAGDAVASLSRLYQEDDEESGPGQRPLTVVQGRVCLEDVHFRYATTGRYSVRGVSLEIPPGTSVALVGASGSGKSTIASLVLGFYQPERGRISIDGHDLAEVDRRTYRQQIGVVSQDVILFQGTILDNIAWGDPQPDIIRAREAASLAQALGFIESLPGGFDHELRDGGGGLSGGQRQRLALARAIYRDPRLLILDEATSALDPDSERLVQEALEHILVGRTTLIIAHRLHTVRRAGLVLVLQDGAIVERGTYEDLIRSNGHFSRMARHQLQ